MDKNNYSLGKDTHIDADGFNSSTSYKKTNDGIRKNIVLHLDEKKETEENNFDERRGSTSNIFCEDVNTNLDLEDETFLDGFNNETYDIENNSAEEIFKRLACSDNNNDKEHKRKSKNNYDIKNDDKKEKYFNPVEQMAKDINKKYKAKKKTQEINSEEKEDNDININRFYRENTRKLDNNLIAATILKKHHFIFYSGSLYYYNKPIYERVSEHEGMILIKKLVPCDIVVQLSSYDLKEILVQISTSPEIQKIDDDMGAYKNYICFKNGVYNIKRRRLEKHKPENYFFSYINLNYNPNEITHGKVFEEYLEKCSCGDNEIKKLIMEMIGYIISNSMAAKKIFVIHGVQDSGKSTFGNFMQYLIGSENCCSIQPQDIGKRFQVSELIGKKLCFNMDILDSPIKDTGVLKLLSGGDMIPAERKYEPIFSFKNQAKILYGCNNLPKVFNSEGAKAFFNRLIIIPFRYSVPPEEQDKNLIKKLIAESNYIVNKSIQAYENLKANNYIFTTCKQSEESKKEFIERENNVIEFVHKCCILDKNYKIHSSVMYQKYLDFCNENSYMDEEILSLSKFASTIANNFNVTKSKWRQGDVNSRGFIGITVKGTKF